MKKILYFVFVVLAALSINLDGCGNPEARQRKRLVKQFVGCVPDSLDDERRQEIQGLFDTFWERVDMGKVFPEDADSIEAKLRRYVGAGRISGKDLTYFMAEVGYYSYRKNPRYNLPEGVVDHPTLNPDAALIIFGADSLGPRMQLYYRVPSPDTTADTIKTPSAEEGR
jgi:hypothetical protein